MNIFIQFSTADSPDGMKQKPKKDASFKFYLPKAETQNQLHSEQPIYNMTSIQAEGKWPRLTTYAPICLHA